jgi:hypothetical protein
MSVEPTLLDQLEATIDYGQGIERRGLGYALAESDGGTPFEVTVSRLHSSGGELRGELRVAVDGRHLSAGSFNLSSLAARATTAKLLATRAPSLPWGDILERLCVCVIARERAGVPVAVVGGRPIQSAGPARDLDPWLPHGHPSVLFAPGGSGKSTVAAAAAVSLEAGVEVIPGFRPPRRQRVLILDWESCADDWSTLLAGVSEGAGLEAPRIAYLAMTRPLADDVERVAEVVSERSIGVIVVDSVGLALGMGRDVGDPADAVLRLHQAIRHLRVTSLLLDHVSGADIATGTNAASRPYGSVYKLNAARDVWELRREHEPRDGVAQVLLIHAKANLSGLHAPIGLRIIHAGGVVRFERGEVTAPELEGRLSTRQRMHRALAVGALTTRVLADQLGIPEASVRSSLLRHGDVFQRLSDGRIGLKA